MMRHIALSAAAALVIVGTGACVPMVAGNSGPSHGPPVHAPAHGRRIKRGGHELELDPMAGVYIVLGLPHYYFWADHYYRLIDGAWRVSVEVGGPWTIIHCTKVPRGLIKKHGSGNHGPRECAFEYDNDHEHDDDEDEDEDEDDDDDDDRYERKRKREKD